MIDIILSQLGIKPDELKQMAAKVTENVESVNTRLTNIETQNARIIELLEMELTDGDK